MAGEEKEEGMRGNMRVSVWRGWHRAGENRERGGSSCYCHRTDVWGDSVASNLDGGLDVRASPAVCVCVARLDYVSGATHSARPSDTLIRIGSPQPIPFRYFCCRFFRII